MSFRSAAFATAALLAAVSLSGQARADCLLSIEPGQDQWAVRYDPFAQDSALRQFDVALFNRGDTPCEGQLSVNLQGAQYGLAMPGEGERVAYALIDERAGADVTPRSGQSFGGLGTQSVMVAPGERSLVRFTFMPDTGDLLSAGTYAQDAFLSFSDGAGMSLAERPVSLSLTVVSAALMGLKGRFERNDGIARIDLGELRPGPRSLQTSLFVLSTAGYSVTVTSDNGGQLRLGESGWFVEYALAMGQERMDLKSGATLWSPSRQAQENDYDLSVDIDSVEGVRAGEYTDVLTFTVTAL